MIITLERPESSCMNRLVSVLINITLFGSHSSERRLAMSKVGVVRGWRVRGWDVGLPLTMTGIVRPYLRRPPC